MNSHDDSGNEDLVEESKVPDPSLVDTGDGGGNDPHGEMGRSGVMQAVTQIQHIDDNAQD